MKPDSVDSWMVAVGGCFLNLMILGTGRLSGLIYVDAMERYNVDRAAASFPFSVTFFMSSLSGPFIGCLANKVGLRLVVILGVLLDFIGVTGCYFAESIGVITISWGFIHGISIGVMMSLLPTIVVQYFERQKAAACGITVLGMSLGALVFPPIYHSLVQKYGLSGTFLILGGLQLNCLPVAFLLKKPNFPCSQSITKSEECVGKEAAKYLEYQTFQSARSSTHIPKPTTNSNKTYLIHLPPTEQQNKTKNDRTCSSRLTVSDSKPTEQQNNTKNDRTCSSRLTVSDSKPTEQQNKINNDRTCPSMLTASNFRLLTHPMFITILISVSINKFSFACMSTINADFAKDVDVAEDLLPYVLVSEAVGETIGRLCLGMLSDSGCISKHTFMALAFCGEGFVLLWVAASEGFYNLISALVVDGFFHSTVLIMCSPIAADVFPVHQQVLVIASSTVLAAPLNLSVSPLIGFFREHLGSYKYIYYLMCCFSFLGSFLWLTMSFFIKKKTVGSDEKVKALITKL